jgi:hypothetical protein
MVVFMFRPSPQCPRPSLNAARRCFPACKSNIYMHRDQIRVGNVDMTWIFTQAMFMTINTILWTLSYEPIRSEHPREEVQEDLQMALDCIRIASERWPGVSSALELYKTLIAACMRIYDKDGDVLISAASPTETTGYDSSRSRTTSPAAQIFTLPPGNPPSSDMSPPFVAMGPLAYDTSPPASGSNVNGSASSVQQTEPSTSVHTSPYQQHQQPDAVTAQDNGYFNTEPQTSTLNQPFDAGMQFPLPSAFPNMVSWNPSFDFSATTSDVTIPAMSPFDRPSGSNMDGFGMSPSNVPYSDYLYPPSWDMKTEIGLNQAQQVELMQTLESTATGVIEHMIDATNAVFYPPNRRM